MTLAQLWWKFLLLIVFSYLFGNINSAILISKLKKQDIRTLGSGNPGTLNMSRNFGLKVGLLVLVLDVAKGVIPTLIGRLVFGGALFTGSEMPIWVVSQYVCGFSVVLGHIYPVVFKFKGGKGIASTIGVFLVGEWYVTLIFCVVAVAFILATKIGSMGSFIATTPSALVACFRIYTSYFDGLNGDAVWAYVVVNLCVFLIVFCTWFAHRKNIERILSGDEHDTNWSDMLRKLIRKKKKKNNSDNTHLDGGNGSSSDNKGADGQ